MILLTNDNYEAMITRFRDQIKEGSVQFEYRLYEGNTFITECDSFNFHTTLKAYEHLDLTIESWLHGPGIDDSVRDKG